MNLIFKASDIHIQFRLSFMTMAVEESTAPSGKPNIILIPWDTESPEHCERLFQQRIACGWKSDKIEKWKVYQREGKMSIHWAVSEMRLFLTTEYVIFSRFIKEICIIVSSISS